MLLYQIFPQATLGGHRRRLVEFTAHILEKNTVLDDDYGNLFS